MFCHLCNVLVIETNENQNVEEPPILAILSLVCWAAVNENEGDYIFDDSI